jgi:hypothetical protein
MNDALPSTIPWLCLLHGLHVDGKPFPLNNILLVCVSFLMGRDPVVGTHLPIS